eukprot:jgi/Botrbrau1/20133/Bobra.0173s0035.1
MSHVMLHDLAPFLITIVADRCFMAGMQGLWPKGPPNCINISCKPTHNCERACHLSNVVNKTRASWQPRQHVRVHFRESFHSEAAFAARQNKLSLYREEKKRS